MNSRVFRVAGSLLAAAIGLAACSSMTGNNAGMSGPAPRRNVVIFVADGLRYGSVNPTEAPTMYRLRRAGVDFRNSHALFPTFTMPNASAIATGHYLGDTGNYGNTLMVGFPVFNRGNFGKPTGTVTPFIENDEVLGDIDDHFANGNPLNEMSLLAAAREHGYSTAAIGKLGPAAHQDVSQLKPVGQKLPVPQTVIIDDLTGSAAGIPLSAGIAAALARDGVPAAAPARDQPAGNVATPGTTHANLTQQNYLIAATLTVLQEFRKAGRPFMLVYWSRDPDGSQHNHGDSLNKLEPGINGRTSRQSVTNADANLKKILDFLAADPALQGNTDVFLTADHGFATISKHEVDAQGGVAHGYATQFAYVDAKGAPEVNPGWLPPGFLALDLAHELGLTLHDPDSQVAAGGQKVYQPVDPAIPRSTAAVRQRPAFGNGLLGASGRILDKTDAKVVVAANGGADLIYVPDRDAAAVRRIVAFLAKQDYTGAIFVDSGYGDIPGALPMSAAGLEGSAQLPRPAVALSFKTFSTDPANPLMTAVQLADTGLQEGQGMHGSFGRDNTYNNMAAIGPDFKAQFVDTAPIGNADIAVTVAHILGWNLPSQGKLQGRVLTEALANGPAPADSQRKVLVSGKDAGSGRVSAIRYQVLGEQAYFDVACFVTAEAAQDTERVCQ